MTTNAFVTEVQTLMAAKEVELAKLERRMARDREVFEALSQDLVALRQTLDVYRSHHRLPVVETETDQVIDPSLRDRTAREAIVELSRLRGGRLVVAEAAKILVRIGMYQSERNASANIYSALSNHGERFRKLRPGMYELLEARPRDGETLSNEQFSLPPPDAAVPRPDMLATTTMPPNRPVHDTDGQHAATAAAASASVS